MERGVVLFECACGTSQYMEASKAKGRRYCTRECGVRMRAKISKEKSVIDTRPSRRSAGFRRKFIATCEELISIMKEGEFRAY